MYHYAGASFLQLGNVSFFSWERLRWNFIYVEGFHFSNDQHEHDLTIA
jgi:hypothetical protein